MKRILFTHFGIIIALFILGQILSIILNVGTVNTWLGDVFANAMGITLYKMFYDMFKLMRPKNPVLSLFFFFCLAIITLGLIMVNVIIIGNLFFDMGW